MLSLIQYSQQCCGTVTTPMLKMRESYEEVKSCGQATYFVKRQGWDSETDDVREGMRMKENENSPSIRTDGALQGKSISIASQNNYI